MSILTLNDGTTINVLETSTTSQIIVQGNLEEVTRAMTEITTDSLQNANLAGTTLVNKVYTGFSGTKEEDVYTVTFNLRDKTDMELLFGKVQDVEDGLAEVADIVAGM